MTFKLIAARSAAYAVCLVALAVIACAQVNHPPVEAFGSLPAISGVQISPDGKHMVALQTYHGRTAVVIYEVGAPPGTIPAILIDEMHYILQAQWANNERVLVTIYQSAKPELDFTRLYPFTRTFSIDTQAKNPVMLLKNSAFALDNTSSSIVADLNLDDPIHIIMPLWAEHLHAVSLDLYSVDVLTGMGEVIFQGKGMTTSTGDEHTIDWIMDGHGHVVGRVDRSQEPLIDHLKLYKDGSWVEMESYDAEVDRGAHIAGLTADGTALARAARNQETDLVGVVALNIATGVTTPLYFNTKYDIDSLLLSDWDSRIIGVTYTDDIQHSRYFDPEMQALQKGLEAAFPGQNVVIQSMDLARERVTVMASSTSQPPTYYLLNRTTHFAGRIGNAYPSLRPGDLGVVKPYPYKSRDGLDIPAYLTLPPGKTPNNLPVVVFPHGGPEVRDSMDFDWWAQFMANRGYAVLQPNFRGSTGYGYKFVEAGFHQWGLQMQDDITDGVMKLIADGIADPKRICIVGASYGGYAALAGATFTPDLYACAVSVAGISDLPKLLDDTEDEAGQYSKAMSYLNSRIGNTSSDRARLDATSPARHADRVRCPVLLMHGESDFTVPIDQSQEEYDRLRRAGKSVEFIRFEGDEDHYLERAETRIRMLTEIEKFLTRNIGN
jgi:acetyl esterase/lipase